MKKQKQNVMIKGRIIPKRRVSSLDVDPEKGFSELCPEELPVPGALEIVPELEKQAEYAHVRALSKDAHPAKSDWAATEERPQLTPILAEADMDLRWNIHCVPGTPGFELLPGLRQENYQFIAYKGIEPNRHPYGACYRDLADTESTGLIEFLLVNGIGVVIVGGLATSWCLKTTVLQLCRDGRFAVYVNLAACRDIPGSPTVASIEEMRVAGAIILESSSEISWAD